MLANECVLYLEQFDGCNMSLRGFHEIATLVALEGEQMRVHELFLPHQFLLVESFLFLSSLSVQFPLFALPVAPAWFSLIHNASHWVTITIRWSRSQSHLSHLC